MAVSFKLFRLIRWSASSGKSPVVFFPANPANLERRGREEGMKRNFGRAGGESQGTNENKSETYVHLLSVHHPFPFVLSLGREKSTIDIYFLRIFSFYFYTSYLHPLFRTFISFLILEVLSGFCLYFSAFFGFYCHDVYAKWNFYEKRRFALLFYAFFVHSVYLIFFTNA